jgi:hypothetical protein
MMEIIPIGEGLMGVVSGARHDTPVERRASVLGCFHSVYLGTHADDAAADTFVASTRGNPLTLSVVGVEDEKDDAEYSFRDGASLSSPMIVGSLLGDLYNTTHERV